MEALFMSDPLLANLANVDGAPGNNHSHVTTFPDASPYSGGQPPDLGLTGKTAMVTTTYRSHGEQDLRFGNTISLTSAQDSDQTLDLLFTDKNGEAEFIGILPSANWEMLTMSRFGVRAVDILTQGHGLGQ
jgi:hypothetical protein